MSPIDELIPILKKLRLSGILQTLEMRLRQAVDGELSHTELVLRLLTDEAERRDGKQIQLRVSRAGFEHHKTLEDTRNYIRFHLIRADVDGGLFTDQATKQVFQATQGRPRAINQLCLQALVQAAVEGLESIDGKFMAAQIAAHPLYQSSAGGGR